jgi:hypothetical protein
MAKYQIDGMLDAALNFIKTNATLLTVCKAGIDSAITYAKATNDPSTSAGMCLAKTAPAALVIGSPADGAVSGRKVTVPQQDDLTILGSGANDAARLVIVGTVASVNTVLYITETATQSLTAGNLVTTPAFAIELADAL